MPKYYDRNELWLMTASYRDQIEKLRQVVVELAAAVAWMDKNGYQSKMLARTLSEAAIDPKKVEEFNEAKRARIAAWRDKQAGA